jgi:hypothetical protein
MSASGTSDEDSYEAGESRSSAGRWLTTGCFALLVLLPIVGEIVFIARRGYLDPVCPIWFLLILLLAIQTWRGFQWARKVAGLFHLFLALPLLFAVVAAYSDGAQNDNLRGGSAYPISILLLLPIVLPSLTLLFASPVRNFVEMQSDSVRRESAD